MKIQFSRQFDKDLKRAPYHIRISVNQRLGWFIDNNFHPLLHNHPLKGAWENHRSINITGDWRALYTIMKNTKTILFIKLGTHSELYK